MDINTLLLDMEKFYDNFDLTTLWGYGRKYHFPMFILLMALEGGSRAVDGVPP